MSRALRALACFALASFACAPDSFTPFSTLPPASPTPEQPLFRLGDAAAPFGWSTAIADFNTDGTPDVAVADRVVPGGSGHAYRLEFSVSGQPPRDVTFESSDDAITVTVEDVDRDNDLDVVVETPLSGETVGVWLNDGRGHFTAGDARQIAATMRPLQSLGPTDADGGVGALDWTPHSAGVSIAACRTIPSRSSRRGISLQSRLLRSVPPLDRSTPRAPPAILLDLWS